MNEDEQMFGWGIGMAIFVLFLTVALQVCYRIQDKSRARSRGEIVKTQQEYAARAANFAAFVRPEILRNLVVSVYPKAEVVSFNKSIGISEIKFRE